MLSSGGVGGAKQAAARDGDAGVPRCRRVEWQDDGLPDAVHGHPRDHLDDGSANGGRMFDTTAGRRSPTLPHVAGDVAELRFARALDIDITQLWQLPRASVEQPDHRTLAREQIEEFADHAGDLCFDARAGRPQGSLQDWSVGAFADCLVEEDPSRIHPACAQRERGEIDITRDVCFERCGPHREFKEGLVALGAEVERADGKSCLPRNIRDLR